MHNRYYFYTFLLSVCLQRGPMELLLQKRGLGVRGFGRRVVGY